LRFYISFTPVKRLHNQKGVLGYFLSVWELYSAFFYLAGVGFMKSPMLQQQHSARGFRPAPDKWKKEETSKSAAVCTFSPHNKTARRVWTQLAVSIPKLSSSSQKRGRKNIAAVLLLLVSISLHTQVSTEILPGLIFLRPCSPNIGSPRLQMKKENFSQLAWRANFISLDPRRRRPSIKNGSGEYER